MSVVDLFGELVGHLFKLLFRAAGTRLGELETTVEAERQARHLLKNGWSLLENGLVHDADVRFGLALRLWPEVVSSLPKKQQKRLLEELESAGYDETPKNIKLVWIQLDRLRRAWGSRWEGPWYS